MRCITLAICAVVLGLAPRMDGGRKRESTVNLRQQVGQLSGYAIHAEDGKPQPGPAERSKPVREQVRGGAAFPPDRRTWTRITGKVAVLDAHRLRFEDATEANLNWNMNAPELDQQGLIGDSLYPAGRVAAEFLRKLIGDRPVTFFGNPEDNDPRKMRGACLLGETSVEIEMVRNGWALSDHEGMDPWEIMARENRRGLWRGQFVVPGRWRQGERLPGEPAARKAQR